MLSKEFYYLPLYEKLVVDKYYLQSRYIKQSKSFLSSFLSIHPIRTLEIVSYNRNLFVDPKHFSYLKKLIIHDMTEKEYYITLHYFSRYCRIENLKIKYVDVKCPDVICKFKNLKTLDITITQKCNETTILELIRQNQKTLLKLKISIYSGMGIDEQNVKNVIMNHLCLETIEIRDDLFSHEMIHPWKTKFIKCAFVYQPEFVGKLKNIVELRLDKVKNVDLENLCKNLSVVKYLFLWGILENFEKFTEEQIQNFPKILHRSDWKEEKYNASVGTNIHIKSPFLERLFCYAFTIDGFHLENPYSLKYLTIENVHVKNDIVAPGLIEFRVENGLLNPLLFDLKHFKFPNLRSLDLFSCYLPNTFLFHRVKSLNIQHCIMNFDIYFFLKKYKLNTILFYRNEYKIPYNSCQMESFLKKRKIDFHTIHDW